MIINIFYDFTRSVSGILLFLLQRRNKQLDITGKSARFCCQAAIRSVRLAATSVARGSVRVGEGRKHVMRFALAQTNLKEIAG